MQICVHVQPNDALAAGHDKCGSRVIAISAADLSEAQKAELVKVQATPDSWSLFDYDLPKVPPAGVAGPQSTGTVDVLAYLDRLAAHRAATLAADAQARKDEIAKFVTAANTYLATDMRDDHLRLLAYEAPKARRELLDEDAQRLLDRVQKREYEARAELKQRRDAEQAKAAAEEREAAIVWINNYGSPRLQRLLSEGIEYRALLRKEQTEHARKQLPAGWSLLSDLPTAERTAPENSEPETLMLLDLARTSIADAWLGRFVITTTGGERHEIEMPVAVFDNHDIVFTFPHEFEIEEDVEEPVEDQVAARKRAAADSYAALLQDLSSMTEAATAAGRQDRAATLAELRAAINAVAQQHGVRVNGGGDD